MWGLTEWLLLKRFIIDPVLNASSVMSTLWWSFMFTRVSQAASHATSRTPAPAAPSVASSWTEMGSRSVARRGRGYITPSVSGQIVYLLTVPFMSRHYRCSHCDDVIDGKIITLDNKFVCGKCSDEVTLQLTVQISINHRSGQGESMWHLQPACYRRLHDIQWKILP